MEDRNISNLELFYDCLDESNNLLYEIYKKPYFELIEMTVNNILAGEIQNDFENQDDYKKLEEIYSKIKGIDFSVEDVRKAMQSIILRGFKEIRIPNGNTTPDTIGIFMAYLISKMSKNKEISILDPLCGTSNLLLTIANHLNKECKLFACDNDLWMTKLSKMMADLMNYNVDIYYQDTLTLNLSNIDAIVLDMPHSEYIDNKYFPYEALKHYSYMLGDKGFIIAMVENDFIDYDKDHSFKKEILKDLSITGLVELPDEMFKAVKPKTILVLQKIKLNDQKCFMVKLPNFSDVSKFNDSLLDIEAWFKKNNY